MAFSSYTNTSPNTLPGDDSAIQYRSLVGQASNDDGTHGVPRGNDDDGLISNSYIAATKNRLPNNASGSWLTRLWSFQNTVDWVILVLLAAMDMVLYFFVDPFDRFVNKAMIYTNNLMFPLNSDTVPFWLVPIISAVVPAVIMLAWPVLSRPQRFALFRGVLFAVLLAGVLTDALKLAIGRPRPNFFWRCFPSGDESYDETTGEVICNGVSTVVQEGHKSFPSGHASWCFAGLGFLSMFLNQVVNVNDQHKNNVGKLVGIVAPLFIAIAIAITRVNDYMHHWQDVTVGGIIGLVAAKYSFNKLCLEPSTRPVRHGLFHLNTRVGFTRRPRSTKRE